MSKSLKILALLGTVTGAIANLGVIPILPAHISLFIIAVSLALHQLVDVIGDFLDNGKTDWRGASPLLIGALVIGGLGLASLTACSNTGAASSPGTSSGASSTGTVTSTGTTTSSGTNLVTVGYEIENFLQRFNTGVDAAVPPVDAFLTETHNSGDAQTVALYATLATEFAATVNAGLQAALPPQQVQAAANSTLAPAAILPAVSNVIATTPASTGTITSTTGTLDLDLITTNAAPVNATTGTGSL
jgi:hypothetical protein